jgi:hypothetical protein
MPATTSGAARPEASTSRAATGETAMQATAATPPTAAACRHQPACPPPGAADRYRAHVAAAHPEQGWSLLCNGVVVFDDLGALLPDRLLVPALRR